MDDSIARNREHWESVAGDWVEGGRRGWARDEPWWGVWHIPESELGLLPDVAGSDVVELGCGTAYVSAWLARRGGRPIGVDPTRAQLLTAKQLQREFEISFPLVQAAAEQVPLRSSSFDLVISEYGAAIWADPRLWIPEAARLLRPGGDLVYLGNSSLFTMCVPEEDDLPPGRSLLRPQFEMHRVQWPDTVAVEFHVSHGETIRLLRASGFDVLDLVELRPGPDATTRFPYHSLEWARQWPAEEAWLARRR
jgi:SAM-dependent methyltransferase